MEKVWYCVISLAYPKVRYLCRIRFICIHPISVLRFWKVRKGGMKNFHRVNQRRPKIKKIRKKFFIFYGYPLCGSTFQTSNTQVEYNIYKKNSLPRKSSTLMKKVLNGSLKIQSPKYQASHRGLLFVFGKQWSQWSMVFIIRKKITRKWERILLQCLYSLNAASKINK